MHRRSLLRAICGLPALAVAACRAPKPDMRTVADVDECAETLGYLDGPMPSETVEIAEWGGSSVLIRRYDPQERYRVWRELVRERYGMEYPA